MAASAFAALVSLENNLLLIRNHPRHHFSFEEKQIQSLLGKVTLLIGFMKSYDNSHGARKGGAEAIEMRIARVAHAAEDIIETHVVDQIRAGKTRSGTRSSRYLLDLQKAIQDMEFMHRKAMKVRVRSGMEVEGDSSSTPLPLTNMTSEKNSMVGFDDIFLQLLHLLTGEPSSLQVIPIVGMGGSGKTTLATNAFQHSLIVDHFDLCLWATISQQYSVETILSQLLFHLKMSSSGSVDELRERLYKSLCWRRYLIVLDDMWSVEAWDEIKFVFPDMGNGSRIVVTTRNLLVARHLSTSRLLMRFLNEENSWDLFCEKAFAGQGCPHELEEIGKKIVQKCKGLPLAIVVIAGHLRKSSMKLEYWESVAHHLNSVLNSDENDEQCLNVLYLSYSYLPAHLKPCFLLLGAFPEDQRIYVDDVYRLWIAEGFIQHFEKVSLEEVAKYYLWDLCQRYLIIDATIDLYGDIFKFTTHDVVREMCLKIAKKEGFISVFETPWTINRERRVVISRKAAELDHQPQTFDSPIRCLISEGDWPLYNFKLLRTLDKVVMASIGDSVFQQLNLRYLNVDLVFRACPTRYHLPSSMSLLWNLQTLRILTPENSVVIAPYEIWEMLQLRYVEVFSISIVDPLPVVGANDLVLRNLYTLMEVENLRLSEEVCKRIPNVRELWLSYCDEASSFYCPHNLGCFNELEYLRLKFDGNLKWRELALSLTFPTSIQGLHLKGCGVGWEELTMMVGSLPNLVCLELYRNSVTGSVWTPVEGKFLSLKTLLIIACDDLVHWNADISHFPALKDLRLHNLSKLDVFPSGIGDIPTLRSVQLHFCSTSSTISAMKTLVEQEEQGNEDLRLRVILRGDEEELQRFNDKIRDDGLTSANISLSLQKV